MVLTEHKMRSQQMDGWMEGEEWRKKRMGTKVLIACWCRLLFYMSFFYFKQLTATTIDEDDCWTETTM